nr:hypothetical protein [Rahnella sp. PD12R]
MADVGGDLFTGHLRAFDIQAVTGADVEVPACAHFRVSPGGAVAVIFASGGVDVGEDADPRLVITDAKTDADIATGAGVFTGVFLGVIRSQQMFVLFC